MSEKDRLIPFGDAVNPPSKQYHNKTNSKREKGEESELSSFEESVPSNGMKKQITEDGNESSLGDLVVYKRRWFILALFSMLYCIQTAAWNTWGPIADTVQAVLGWSYNELGLLANWGPITLVLTAFIFSYLLRIKGLRFTVLGSALLLLLGVGIRCLPVGIDNVRWTAHLGQIVIGFACPIFMAAPTELSAVWFPSHQRTTSTAIAAMAYFIGVAVSYFIGPLVVSTVPPNVGILDPAIRMQLFNEIMRLMYIECGITALLVVAALLYFPNKPPTSPSVTAAEPRESFKKGAIKMITTPQFWIPAIAYSLTAGVYQGWTSQLDVILESSVDVNQSTVGWIGVIMNLVATLGGLITGRCVDAMGGHMKPVLILFSIAAVLSCLWCVLITMKYIAYSTVSLCIACVFIGLFVNAPVPVYFEIAVEGMYPVSEGNVNMVMVFLMNAASLVFLMLLMIPNIGVLWMNWLFMGAVFVCLPLLLLYKESYNRMNADKTRDSDERSNGGFHHVEPISKNTSLSSQRHFEFE